MRAVQVSSFDGPSSVSVTDVPDAVAGPGDVLVEVRALGIAWPDLLLTRGLYQVRPELPFSLGLDLAGTVRSAPPGSGFAVGDRVAAVMLHGGGADLVAVHPDAVFPLPDAVSFVQGAALPLNYLTAEFALTTRGGVRAGDTVLVHGAAGGVGTASVQVAKGLGARVLAVVSTPEKAAVARRAGADEVVLVDGFLAATRELTGGRGVDAVVDPVGGDLMTDSLRSLAPHGRVLVIGFTGGSIPQVKVNRLLLNNIDVRGVGWGDLAMRTPGFMRRQWETLLPMMGSGVVDPPIGRVRPLAEVVDALLDLEARRTLGKTVVVL